MRIGHARAHAIVEGSASNVILLGENYVQFKPPENIRVQRSCDGTKGTERVYFDKCSLYPNDLEKLHSDLDIRGLVEQVARCGIKAGIFFAGVGILKKRMHAVGVLDTVITTLKNICGRFSVELSYGCYGVTDSQCIDWIECLEADVKSYKNVCNHVLQPEKAQSLKIPNMEGLRRLPFVFVFKTTNFDTKVSGSLYLVDLGTPFDTDHTQGRSDAWHPPSSKLDVGVFKAVTALHKLVDMLGPNGVDGEADLEQHALTTLVRDALIQPSRLNLCLLIGSNSNPNRMALALKFARSWKKLRTMEIESPASPGRLSLESELRGLREKFKNTLVEPAKPQTPDSSLVLKVHHICEISNYRNQVRKLSSLLEISRLRSKKLITTLMVKYVELEESQRLASVARIQQEYYCTKLKWKISVLYIRVIILRRLHKTKIRALISKLAALEGRECSIDKSLVESILADRSIYIQREKILLKKLEKYKKAVLLLSASKNSKKQAGFGAYKKLKTHSKSLASQLLAAKLKIESKRKKIGLLEKILANSSDNSICVHQNSPVTETAISSIPLRQNEL